MHGFFVETDRVRFAGVDFVSYTFAKTHLRVPTVTLTAEGDDVQMHISNLTLKSMEIKSSGPFDGWVQVHIISAG